MPSEVWKLRWLSLFSIQHGSINYNATIREVPQTTVSSLLSSFMVPSAGRLPKRRRYCHWIDVVPVMLPLNQWHNALWSHPKYGIRIAFIAKKMGDKPLRWYDHVIRADKNLLANTDRSNQRWLNMLSGNFETSRFLRAKRVTEKIEKFKVDKPTQLPNRTKKETFPSFSNWPNE